MLTVQTSNLVGQGTKGQLLGYNFQVTSTNALPGKTLIIDPAAWLDEQPTDAGTVPQSSYFSVLYPSGVGTITCDFIGIKERQNFNVEVEAIDNFTFEVTVWFVHRYDADDWHSQVNILPLQSFESSAGIYDDLDKWFAVRVFVQNSTDSAVYSIPYTANDFCEDSSFDFQYFDGSQITDGKFDPNKDFEISFSLDVNLGTQINNNFSVGIYRVDTATNSGLFTTDLQLNYGFVSAIDNVTSPSGLLPVTAFAGAIPFTQYDVDVYRGRIVIDKDYLEEGGRYVVYIVYKKDGDYQSCRTQVLVSNNAPAYGSTTCTATLNGQTFTTCCLVDVPPYSNLKVCNAMNQDEYNAALALNSQGGSYSTNFVSLSAYLTDTLPVSGTQVTGTSLPVDDSGCVDFYVDDTLVDTQLYVVFAYKFNVDGNIQVIYSTFEFNVNDSIGGFGGTQLTDSEGSPLSFICTDTGNVIVAFFAIGTQYTFNATLVNGDDEVDDAIISSDVHVNSFGEAQVIIDTSVLEIGEEYCLEVSGINDNVPVIPPTNCKTICSSVIVNATQQTVSNNGTTAGMSFKMQSDDFAGDPVQFVQVQIQHAGGTDLWTPDPVAFDNGDEMIHFFSVPSNTTINVVYQIQINLLSGCKYIKTLYMQTSGNTSSDLRISTTSFDLCDELEPPPPPNGDCENYLSITPECTETGVIAVFEKSLTSTSFSEEKRYSTDNGVTWKEYTGEVSASSVWFEYVIETNDCLPKYVAYAQIDCDEGQICNNNPAISIAVDYDLQTILPTNTGTYSSVIVAENFEYSIDNGVSWINVTGAIDISTLDAGDTVIVRLNPSYEDGCPQIEVTEIFTKGQSEVTCDYSAFSLECEYFEASDTFSANFEGCVLPGILEDTSELIVDQQEYSIDLGMNWQEYTIPVQTTGQAVLFRWIIQYEGCDPVTLVAACVKPCNPCEIEFPDTLDVNIIGTVQMEIINCVQVCDDTLCTTPPEAGTGSAVTVCI